MQAGTCGESAEAPRTAEELSRLPYRPAAAKAAPPVPCEHREANKGPRTGRYCKTGLKQGSTPTGTIPSTLSEMPTRGHAEADAAGQTDPAAGCCKVAAQHDQKQVRGSEKEPLLREALSGVTDKRAFSGSDADAKADSGPGSGSAHRRRKPCT